MSIIHEELCVCGSVFVKPKASSKQRYCVSCRRSVRSRTARKNVGPAEWKVFVDECSRVDLRGVKLFE